MAVKMNSKCILGLALARSMSSREGKQMCEEALQAAATAGNRPAVFDYRLELSEILLANGEPRSAIDEIRPVLGGNELADHKEAAWRVWAVVATAYSQFGAWDQVKNATRASSACLQNLRTGWNEADFGRYSQRFDIRNYQKQLLTVAAKSN
jgi:hypothetical protein